MPSLAASQEMHGARRASRLRLAVDRGDPGEGGPRSLGELAEAEGAAARADVARRDSSCPWSTWPRHHDVEAEVGASGRPTRVRPPVRAVVVRMAAGGRRAPCATSRSPSSMRCGTRRRRSWGPRMGPGRPRPARQRRGRRGDPPTRWRHDDREPGADPSSLGAAAGRAAGRHDDARRPEVGGGLVPDPRRRHGGPLRGHDRGPRAATPAWQGERLGHRRVLHAAALHRRAGDARGDRRQDRRPDPRDTAPGRALAARGRRPRAPRRADGHGGLRRPAGRRRDPDGQHHRRLRGPRHSPHHLRHGAPPGRQGGGGLGRDPRGHPAA